MIRKEEIGAVQERLMQIGFACLEFDLDRFLEVAGAASSPQALAAGVSPQAVTGAAKWLEMGRLLKPFRDGVVTLVNEMDDVVLCDCNAAVNPECKLGDHAGGHVVLATWRVRLKGDEDDFFYACDGCRESVAVEAQAQGHVIERLEEDES